MSRVWGPDPASPPSLHTRALPRCNGAVSFTETGASNFTTTPSNKTRCVSFFAKLCRVMASPVVSILTKLREMREHLSLALHTAKKFEGASVESASV